MLKIEEFVDQNVEKSCTHTDNIESQISERAKDIEIEGEFLGTGHFVGK